MPLYNELKRRNVIRVGFAYIVAAWLLIQVAETIFPLFGFGDTPARIIVILLAIGFPLFLVFSWVFEITPEGLMLEKDIRHELSITPKTGKHLDRVIFVLLVLAVGYFAVDKFVFDPARDMEIAEVAARAGAEQAREQARLEMISDKSVAVLPFVNHSKLQEDQYFSDGMHDELLTRLARIADLKVISRTSMEKYRNTDKSLPEIARELGVATILEGGVQRSGNKVRINAQLINAYTDEHLWAETFDRELTAENLFAIQSEVTASIASTLEAQLTSREEKQLFDQPTVSMEAYDFFLHGRQLLASRETEPMKQALQAFKRAVEIDPKFARAWVEVGVANMLLGGRRAIDRGKARENMRQAVETALALDDQSGEAFAVLAMIHQYQEGQMEEAEAAFQKAIELSPGYAPAYMWYALLVENVFNQAEKALELYYKAAELDPLWTTVHLNIADTLEKNGREDEALERYHRLLQIDPESYRACTGIGANHARRGQLAEAIKWQRRAVQLSPDPADMMALLAVNYFSIGNLDAVIEVREQLASLLGVDSRDVIYLDMDLWIYQGEWRKSLMLDVVPAEWDDDHGIRWRRITAYLYGDEFINARELVLHDIPELLEPGKWQDLIVSLGGACYEAGILISSGEKTLGEALLRQSLDYEERGLPAATHWWSFMSPGICYLIDGSYDKALGFFEQMTADSRYQNWWWVKRWPWWGPILDDPRYLALEARIEALLAEQRDLLRQMDEIKP